MIKLGSTRLVYKKSKIKNSPTFSKHDAHSVNVEFGAVERLEFQMVFGRRNRLRYSRERAPTSSLYDKGSFCPDLGLVPVPVAMLA